MIMQHSQDKLVLKQTLPTGIRCKLCGSFWSMEDPAKENWLFQSDVLVFMDIGIVSAEGNNCFYPTLNFANFILFDT